MSIPQGRDGPFNPASPHSSSGLADSFKGTPDTRLTAFSPEDGSTKSLRAPHSIGVNARESGPIRFQVGTPASLNLSHRHSLMPLDPNTDRDPFVSTGASGNQVARKLSPTASCFSPLPVAGVSTSTSQHSPAIIKPWESHGIDNATQLAILSMVSENVVLHELSTDLELSRCIQVEPKALGNKVHVGDMDRYISALNERGLPFKGYYQLYPVGDHVYIRFSNIRDACEFIKNKALDDRDWLAKPLHPRQFAQVLNASSGLVTGQEVQFTKYEGQLTLAAFASSPMQSVDPNRLQETLQDRLKKYGDLFAFKIQQSDITGCLMCAVVEYCDNEKSLEVAAQLSSKLIEGIHICMSPYRPDVNSIIAPFTHSQLVSPTRTFSSSDLATEFQGMSLISPPPTVTSTPAGFLATPTRPVDTLAYQSQASYGMMPVVYNGMPLSPTVPSYMVDQASPRTQSMLPAANYSWLGPVYARQPVMSTGFMTPRQFLHPRDGRRQNAVRVHRSPFHNHNVSGQHNHVDINRIKEGIDVRTTIMLRNIPNKVDQAMLKRIVDESSWGKYDFMYLRIDFANDCNVGYAFINFVDPLDIVPFVEKRGNQRWNCFKSDKVAEISYATIQGKDCLVQKFRNSSVMLEAPHYRPKLYFTMNGPRPELSGQEESFPEPDNQSKMKRSCENAEHVGLFTPNAGQHFRDEQRRRRSQFDRGTRLAAMEEFDFDSSFHPHRSLYPPQ